MDLIAAFGGDVPILGVCLGHQCIGQVFGAEVVRASAVMHGKTSSISHDGQGVFAGLDDPLIATRYHSLVVDPATVPDTLEISARTADGTIMGLRHRSRPIEGVQFHPESVLTAGGHRLVANWLAACGDQQALTRIPA
jgi:para-aminobenzoate synthetase component 2